MKINILGSRRLAYGTLAAVLAVTGLVPVLNSGRVYAGQVQTRSIQMSDNAPGTTGVSYNVSFTSATATPYGGIIIEFCGNTNTPIPYDTSCTIPTGFSVGTPTVTSQSAAISNLTTVASQNSGRTLALSGTPGSSQAAGSTISFTLTTATNPSTANQAFYARIYTYAVAAGATGYTLANPNAGATSVDQGGIAMSTGQAVTVTAKVQEQLSFCVYTGANCAAAGNAITLGNTNGILSSSGPFVDVKTKYDISTNASQGAIVRLNGDTLKSGANSIAAIGGTAASSAAGTAQFGLCNYQSSGTSLVFTGYNTYNSANCSTATQTAGTSGTGGAGTAQFGYNTTNTLSTYGDPIAKANAGNTSTATVPMIANIPVSQVAGIYTTTLEFIATGTY